MARDYDHIDSEAADGELRHKRTKDPTFRDLDADSVSTDALGISGFETVEKDGEIDLGVNANKATYNINNTGADAYLIHVVDWYAGGNSHLGIRPNDYGGGSNENYRWHPPSGSRTNGDDSWSIGSHGSGNNRPGFSRFLIRRAGGKNYVGISNLGGWSRSPKVATHGVIQEEAPLGGEITSFTFLEKDGYDLIDGVARVARVTMG
jgi:hypothetical protein